MGGQRELWVSRRIFHSPWTSYLPPLPGIRIVSDKHSHLRPVWIRFSLVIGTVRASTINTENPIPGLIVQLSLHHVFWFCLARQDHAWHISYRGVCQPLESRTTGCCPRFAISTGFRFPRLNQFWMYCPFSVISSTRNNPLAGKNTSHRFFTP